jgi:hypothetical protein
MNGSISDELGRILPCQTHLNGKNGTLATAEYGSLRAKTDRVSTIEWPLVILLSDVSKAAVSHQLSVNHRVFSEHSMRAGGAWKGYAIMPADAHRAQARSSHQFEDERVTSDNAHSRK